jgi:hypothetical protein
MTKKKIEDLPKDDEISEDGMKSINGGATPQILKTASINIIDVKLPASDIVTAAAGLGPTASAVIGSTK